MKKLTELIQNDSETRYHCLYLPGLPARRRALRGAGGLCGAVPAELPPRTQRRKRPLVYVSLGTVMHGNTGFYRACAEGLGDGPWDVLLSVGSPEGAAALGALPPNVRAEARVEQLRVLGEASVFLTHCGMNSVSESIWCGVPMVLAPQQSEEAAVAGELRSWGRGCAWSAAARRRSGRGGAGAGAAGEVPPAIAPLAAGFRAAGGAARAAEKIEETIARENRRGAALKGRA